MEQFVKPEWGYGLIQVIGGMNKPNRTLCNDLKLNWNQGPHKILGVTFTAEVFDIWDKNTTDIEQKVEILSRQVRKLTLPGI